MEIFICHIARAITLLLHTYRTLINPYYEKIRMEFNIYQNREGSSPGEFGIFWIMSAPRRAFFLLEFVTFQNDTH